ncbi:ROK family transcriptional regulator [Ruania suaedae]|uniref:ROK family transcriptional regulator n=1 Tax=Ruania suaedae TaxID=2897774 RepID=UPI001E36572E|nr:ROK family protein [Ruania suaedae]UFU02087.1 ROK family transcriptional regulator [Ruania suaedae]
MSSSPQLLQVLRDGVPRTRADLVAETGLARSTVTLRLDALLRTGLVRSEAGTSTGGRPPIFVRFDPGARSVLAVDLGAAHVAVAVTDLDGTVLAEHREDLDIAAGPAPVLDLAARRGQDLLDQVQAGGAGPLAGIGIGLPGPVEQATGRPRTPPIMPGWDGADVVGVLGRRFGVPVLVDNDVDLMALGEHVTVYPDTAHLLFVKVATGVGAGIVAGHRLVRGADGTAGDLGHVAVPGGAPVRCRCGNTGCLEALASGTAIVRSVRGLGHEVRRLEEVQGLLEDDGVAEVVRLAGQSLGAVLASCVNLLNPSVIVIGGPLAHEPSPLFEGIEQMVRGRSLPLATSRLQVVASRTHGRAGLLGGARAVIDRVLDPAAMDAPAGAEPAGG